MSWDLMPDRAELLALAAAARWDVYDAAEIHARATGYMEPREPTLAGGLVLGGRLNALVYVETSPETDCPCDDCTPEGADDHALLELLENPEDYTVRVVALNGERIDPEALFGWLNGCVDDGLFLTPAKAEKRLQQYRIEKAQAKAVAAGLAPAAEVA